MPISRIFNGICLLLLCVVGACQPAGTSKSAAGKSSGNQRGAKKEAVLQSKTAYVKGRYLYAPNGERVILRGINQMSVVTDQTGKKTLPQIAKTGANVARLMWMKWGGGASKLDTLLRTCIANNMFPMLEMHDATGKWEKLDVCVDFWLQPEVAAVLKKYEKHLLLNIANEAGNATVPKPEFGEKYAAIVKRMRAAGLNMPLVIDAAKYGRDEGYLLDNAELLLKADPLQNLIFSWHIYDSGISEERIKTAVDRSIAQNMCFIIGEFAPMEVKCKCCIPYKFIIDYAQQKDIGWLAWSWGPGNSDCAQMDMTKTPAFETLHDWGLEVAITDKNSIKNTSKRPAIF